MVDQLSLVSKRHVISLEIFWLKQGDGMNTVKAIRLQPVAVFFD